MRELGHASVPLWLRLPLWLRRGRSSGPSVWRAGAASAPRPDGAAGERDGACGERGSGTVLALGLIGVAAVLLIAVVATFAAAGARSRAQTGADLGALSAAFEVQRGGADPCAAAARAAAGAGAVLRGCRVEGKEVVAETTASVGGGLVGRLALAATGGEASGAARAGPVRDP